jgi:MFS family permease
MFAYVTVLVVWFSLGRAIGETAHMPWRQEYIPNSIRGKFSAKNSVISTLVSFVAVLASSFVVGQIVGLSGYLVLFFVAGLIGLLGIWFYAHIPGGERVEKTESEPSAWSGMVDALRDRNFLLFMFGTSLVILAGTPIASFVPLFMEEEVGISASSVILLQIGALTGTLIFSYVWGWSADRYGSKPALIFSLGWRVLLPILYLFTPRFLPISLPYAMGVSLVQGMLDVGWMISSSRLLYVGVVPPAKKSQYMSLHFAWLGLVGGTSQLLAGRLLDLTSGISGVYGPITIDPYTPLFVLSIVFAVLSIFFFLGVRADGEYGVGEFARMFLRGNPLMAVNSLVRYQFARDEYSVIRVTERLGQAKSPLAIDELLEALKDPRFNVRFEAIISIARSQSDPRLVEALIEALNGTELAISSLAAWALGRLGDPEATDALRGTLDSDYRSIQGQSIRALGALGDEESADLFLDRLRQEEDRGLQMAYASSLGKLDAKEATGDLLALLHDFENEGARLELALALSRLHGDEHYYIQLERQVQEDPGTTMSQAISAFKKQMGNDLAKRGELAQLMDKCALVLSRGDVAGGAELLGEIVEKLPEDDFDRTSNAILRDCAINLKAFKDEHIEYILLALHTMHVGYRSGV